MALKKLKTPLLLVPMVLLLGCSGSESATGATDATDAASAASTQVAEVVEAQTTDPGAGAAFVAGEITVPEGFTITQFHPGIGQRARHLAVRDNGDVLVARINGTLVGLRDSNGDGQADESAERQVAVTTTVEVRDGWLWFSDRVSVSRVRLDENLVPQGEIETMISGFPSERQHADKTFTLDGSGNIYVNSGAPANACQVEMRSPGSPGRAPCPLLENYAGVWKFDGARSGQTPADGTLFVTGVRNAVALQWSTPLNGLFLAVHGRDQLSGLWPDLYTDAQSAELPAEEFHFATEGADLGWPYTYYDGTRNIRYLAPEYGGDGDKQPDTDTPYLKPLHGFAAHWAPNDMLIIDDDRLAPPFNRGVLIAFHGSWNRAPLPQAGYRVSFVPMEGGEISGSPINFAVGFALKDPIISPREAVHRPMGLAQGPDGAIYISDSVKGTIWRVTPDGD